MLCALFLKGSLDDVIRSIDRAVNVIESSAPAGNLHALTSQQKSNLQ